ncbi:MAG: sensor histidine kinase [Salinigranum sp.]
MENLFRNAVEHGPPGVTVRVGALDDEPGFYVADDGPGISRDERERVFERGYTTADSGTGYGLSIVSEIANAHEWSLSVSESDADGARFEIRIGG